MPAPIMPAPSTAALRTGRASTFFGRPAPPRDRTQAVVLAYELGVVRPGG